MAALLKTQRDRRNGATGYMVIMLMLAVFTISVGLLVAFPVWETQIRRDKEEELIFRGKQYMQAVGIYLAKYPGRYPSTLEELLDKKCIRRLYRDPMTRGGEWNVILATGAGAARASVSAEAPQEVLVVPAGRLGGIKDARILGVVSSSTDKSIRLFDDQESYDRWLFYHGKTPGKMPRIKYL